MAFHLVGEETVVAHRDLDRDFFGTEVTTAYRIWRCGHCRALAVGPAHLAPPSKCAKCHY